MNPGIYTISGFLIKHLQKFTVPLVFNNKKMNLSIQSSFFHIIDFKGFLKYFPKALDMVYFRVLYFELTNFYTISIQKTFGCIVVLTHLNFFLDLMMLTKYLASTIIEASSVDHSTRTRIYFLLLSACLIKINYCLHQKQQFFIPFIKW